MIDLINFVCQQGGKSEFYSPSLWMWMSVLIALLVLWSLWSFRSWTCLQHTQHASDGEYLSLFLSDCMSLSLSRRFMCMNNVLIPIINSFMRKFTEHLNCMLCVHEQYKLILMLQPSPLKKQTKNPQR